MNSGILLEDVVFSFLVSLSLVVTALSDGMVVFSDSPLSYRISSRQTFNDVVFLKGLGTM